jgi:hypothetical protein
MLLPSIVVLPILVVRLVILLDVGEAIPTKVARIIVLLREATDLEFAELI